MTHYIILAKHSEGDWRELAGAEASSAKRALATAKLEAGEYVAVPARSWVTHTVKVEQTTKTTIS